MMCKMEHSKIESHFTNWRYGPPSRELYCYAMPQYMYQSGWNRGVLQCPTPSICLNQYPSNQTRLFKLKSKRERAKSRLPSKSIQDFSHPNSQPPRCRHSANRAKSPKRQSSTHPRNAQHRPSNHYDHPKSRVSNPKAPSQRPDQQLPSQQQRGSCPQQSVSPAEPKISKRTTAARHSHPTMNRTMR